jgi:hypothetical protein
MRSGAPPLLPLLRLRVQRDLLALLYLHPNRDYSLPEAAALIGASVKTVRTEASRLIAAGFVRDSRRGNVRLLRAVTGTPVSRPSTDLCRTAAAMLTQCSYSDVRCSSSWLPEANGSRKRTPVDATSPMWCITRVQSCTSAVAAIRPSTTAGTGSGTFSRPTPPLPAP